MTVYLSFDELHDYVVRHYDKDLTFVKIAPDTLKITFTQKILIKEVNISLNVSIEDVRSEAVTISYDGGIALDAIIAGALALLKSRMPALSKGITTSEGHRISVDLTQVDKAQAMVENLSLTEIRIDEAGVRVDADLK